MEEDSIESFANLANWQGFLPPPPRPSFLDELAASDSLTSCEMCSWAYQDGASSMQVTQGKQRTFQLMFEDSLRSQGKAVSGFFRSGPWGHVVYISNDRGSLE